MFHGCLRILIKRINFALVAPETIIALILLLYEGVVADVGGEEGILLGGV